jgi:hypothetical protein
MIYTQWDIVARALAQDWRDRHVIKKKAQPKLGNLQFSIYNLQCFCGADGTRTRDLLRDRQAL